MNETTFLVNLVVKHKLPKEAKELILARLEEIENTSPPSPVRNFSPITKASIPVASQQNASMPAEAGNRDAFKGAIVSDIPVQIAQTPEAAAAMDYRAKLLAGAGKIMPGEKAKKF